MGWNRGTGIFDAVCEVILEEQTVDDDLRKQIISALALALFDQDWDTPEESDYWKFPIVREVMKKVAPDLDWEWIEDEE